MSMGGVAVHHNSPKPAQLNAFAYTQGRDIYLGPGQSKHLAHEAWHVVQQAQGRVRPTMSLKANVQINDNTGLEREADVMGRRAAASQLSGPIALDTRPHSGTKVVQGKFAVEVSLGEFEIDDPNMQGMMQTTHKEIRISAVHIAGRPHGLFKNAEKSHTTAWALYTDQLRNAVLGRTVDGAVTAVHDLYLDAKNLPGVARADNLTGAAKAQYDSAKATMEALVATDHASLAEALKIDHLQRLAKGFLAYRNVIPLSQVDIGAATGHGEPAALEKLRPVNDLQVGWEDNPHEAGHLRLTEAAAEQTRGAMWSLLDQGVIKHFHDLAATPQTTPGMVEGEHGGPTRRIAEVIVQHLWTLESTYETAFRNAEMDGENSVRDYLTQIGCIGPYQNEIYGEIEALYGQAPEKVSSENDDRVLTNGPANQGLFSVQIETSADGKIDKLHIGSRPTTALGTAQGSHSTAWLVYGDAVRLAVLDKNYAGATEGMLTLCEQLRDLPGITRIGNLTKNQRPWLEQAAIDLEKAEAAAKAPSTDLELQPRLQQLIKAYLAFRNTVPLSQSNGGLANANSERRNRAIMRFFESDFLIWTLNEQEPARTFQTLLNAFWNLYDHKAVRKVADHDLEPEDAPGIDPQEDGTLVAADSIKQHLLTMQSAYPKSFAILWANRPQLFQAILDLMEYPDIENKKILERILS